MVLKIKYNEHERKVLNYNHLTIIYRTTKIIHYSKWNRKRNW